MVSQSAPAHFISVGLKVPYYTNCHAVYFSSWAAAEQPSAELFSPAEKQQLAACLQRTAKNYAQCVWNDTNRGQIDGPGERLRRKKKKILIHCDVTKG